MTSDSPSSLPSPDPTALHMGRRITQRRVDLHLSRRWLASLLGVPDHDFRAWEEGTARIDAKTLYELSVLLDTPMTYFVEGLPPPRRPKRLEALIRDSLLTDLSDTIRTAPPEKRRARLLRRLT